MYYSYWSKAIKMVVNMNVGSIIDSNCICLGFFLLNSRCIVYTTNAFHKSILLKWAKMFDY